MSAKRDEFHINITMHRDAYCFQWPKQPNFSARLNKCQLHQGCNGCQSVVALSYNTNSEQEAMKWKNIAMAVLKDKNTKTEYGRRKGQGIIQINEETGIFNLMQQTNVSQQLRNLIDNISNKAVLQQKNNENKNDDNKIDDNKNDEFEDIYVGNIHEMGNGNNSHMWTMFVSIDKNKLIAPKTVKYVKYSLHPTFNPSNITLKDIPFKLSRIGWGIFQIGITIVFYDKCKRKDLICTHMLDFEYPVTMTYVGNREGDQTKNYNSVEDVCHSNNLKNFK
eukprot:303101_1